MYRLDRLWVSAILAIIGLAIAGPICALENPVNSPYPDGEQASNTLFAAFSGRSPKTLDPAQSYSADETAFTYNVYEPLYAYDYLQRPFKLAPRAALSVDEPTYADAQGRALPADAPAAQIAQSIYDIKIRPGMRYQPHPAFARKTDGGYTYFPLAAGELDDKYAIPDFKETGTRELTAADFVYGISRLASPRVASPIYSVLANHIVGFNEYGTRLRQVDGALRAQGRAAGAEPAWLDLRAQPFAGVQALDADTLRIRVIGKYPQFNYWLAMTFTAAVPWEADRFYSQPGMAAHNLSLTYWPVGTGPYMLTESLENRRHVLSRNPNYWGMPYPCEGEPEDRAAGRLRDCGKPTPFIDRAVFSLEKEAIPLAGKFLQGYYDLPQLDRGEFGVSMRVAAGDSPAKAELYADRKIQLPTTVDPTIWYVGFNWRDPVVGQGDTPDQQEKNRKLRQAISIAFDWEEWVAVFEQGQAEVAQGPVPPGMIGYQALPGHANPVVYDLKDGRPQRKSIEAARQLLAQAGYPGGRDARTGAPLVLHYDSMLGGGSDPRFDWMRRQLAKLDIQLDVRATDYNRFQEKMRRGASQLFFWGWNADYPDAENFLFLLYGPNAKAANNGENASNYENPRYDAMFERLRTLNDGPEKAALVDAMVRLLQVDAPWMFGYFPMSGGAYQQWVGNAKPSQMIRNNLQYLRLDPALRVEKIKEWNQPVWWPILLVIGILVLLVLPAAILLKRRERQNAFGEPTPAQPDHRDGEGR